MPRPRARLDPTAVTRAFAPDGLHGATTTAIARCAGVAKPTIYAHGTSKEAIFLACVETEVERLVSRLSAADVESRESPARARLSVLAGAIIAHGHEHPAAARLLHQTARHASSAVAGDVDAALARLVARIATILRESTTPACADRIAPALLGAAAAYAVADAADPYRDAAVLGEAFAQPLERPDHTTGEGVRSIGLY